jgi:hypothetical protein
MDEIERDRYWVVVRDKPGLLRAMMRTLAGGARMSFEGDLSSCEFGAQPDPSGDETQALLRQTNYARQDFVVVTLQLQTIQPILDVVLPERRYMTAINHIQIEKAGRLKFGSYDNFEPECIVCFHGVQSSCLSNCRQVALSSPGVSHTKAPVDGMASKMAPNKPQHLTPSVSRTRTRQTSDLSLGTWPSCERRCSTSCCRARHP